MKMMYACAYWILIHWRLGKMLLLHIVTVLYCCTIGKEDFYLDQNPPVHFATVLASHKFW
uniref:Uncharacterized protein n=1 Tax=Oryza punctata TaxID=4537 RepID=A0A0E0MES6_ORYPU